MKYTIRNTATLKKILWIDFLFGSTAGVAGIVFADFFAAFLGIPDLHVVIISAVTLLYAIGALILARQEKINITLLLVQIYANGFWTIISVGLLVFHFSNATIPGLIYLVLQVIVVGALAVLEGMQLVKRKAD